MANQTVYPYGTGGQLPSSIGLINDLTTGGADKALTAEMGKTLKGDIDQMGIFRSGNNGIFAIDNLLNVAMKYDDNGLDVAKVSSHFIKVLRDSGIAGDQNTFHHIALTVQNNFAVVDEELNIGFVLDSRGVHAKNLLDYEIIND